MKEKIKLSAFREVPKTGVIYVTSEARKRGFHLNNADWCNLGQGQPETDEIPHAPARVHSVEVHTSDQDYAPVAGLPELREAVANLYNERFRKGKASKYTAENVSICSGGRVGIMRACATIAPIHLGHFLPDYTAYEELLDVFRRFQPLPLSLDPEQGYGFSAKQLENEILGRGLGAILMSNPCNPTGKLVHGDLLEEWTYLARKYQCALLMDEFYSHYIWEGDKPFVSAAEYVEDVNRDPVVIFDGLTKNWRYPGWRVSWVVGPTSVIEAVASAGSFLDGGGSRPMQRAAIDLLNPKHADQEATAIRETFSRKRKLLIDGLKKLGITFDIEPGGTFYAWGNLNQLPDSIRNSDDFFHAALDQKVITVPGHFFDVNPGKRRMKRPSRFRHHTRFSFGPSERVLTEALLRLEKVVKNAQ